MSRFYLFIVLLGLLATGCNHEDIDQYNFTVRGRVTNETTGLGVPGVWVYTEYGEPCCGGIAFRKGLDSAKTNFEGKYTLQISYPEDTLIYRFITFLKASILVDRFYIYSGLDLQDIGLTRFEYEEMVAPVVPAKLPDGHLQTCDFTILPVGYVEIDFRNRGAVATDTVSVKAIRLDKNQEYKNVLFYPTFSFDRHLFPITASIPTVLIQENTYNGNTVIVRDTFNLKAGQRVSRIMER